MSMRADWVSLTAFDPEDSRTVSIFTHRSDSVKLTKTNFVAIFVYK